ncbi:MAG: COX15/CtaA family protein [Actinomycetia bacterium]|nr:COX15/CtaA family protein [Actinomycetes bacterium]
MNVFRANLVAQIGIVVTGGLVRLTGSGLGCPTWPECVDGSLVPTSRQEESWHKMIEFGNRLLTFVLAALAIAAIVGAVAWARKVRKSGAQPRRPITLLAAIPLAGTVVQAVLGGITVLTGLHPAIVAGHFLLSIVLIGACVVLVDRAQCPADRPVQYGVRAEVRWLANALVGVAAVVIVLGTIVTGSGPNSGDADVTHRFGFDQRLVAWLHADAVLLFVGLIIGMLLLVRVLGANATVQRAGWILFGVVAVNGLVGYLQLFAGLPWAFVATHMLLACLVWVATLRLRLAMTNRGNRRQWADKYEPVSVAAARRE